MLGAVNPPPIALLDFWFGKLTDGLATPELRKRWFTHSEAFDEECRQFGDLWTSAQSGALKPDWQNPRHCLNFILLTDQIPRNIFRGTAAAFATDALARKVAHRGVQDQLDRTLAIDERAFFYMPFMHSENIIDQHLAVGLFTGLRDSARKEHRSITGSWLRSAQRHRDIVMQFNRFPHRNTALGRKSTAAEEDFTLVSTTFGQH